LDGTADSDAQRPADGELGEVTIEIRGCTNSNRTLRQIAGWTHRSEDQNYDLCF
jgi:hypothetical protein